MKVIYNFYWFLYRLFKHRKDKNIFVTNDIYNTRLGHCSICEFRKTDGILCKLKGPRCSICGCFLGYKLKFNFEECPDENNKKW